MNKPICPQLHIWRQIYSSLEEAHQQAAVEGMPPPPPAYNMQAWELSSDAQKQERWAATVQWATRHGFSRFIDDLSPGEYYEGDDA